MLDRMSKSDRARFWAKVDVRGPADCWPWVAGKFTDGYGAFQLNGKARRSHRLAWSIVNGPIPAGLQVLHSCDNPICMNPDHLRAGTHDDNMRDKIIRNRNCPGALNGNSKLSESDVVKIRKEWPRLTQLKLAAKYGVDRTCIQRILWRKSWRCVA